MPAFTPRERAARAAAGGVSGRRRRGVGTRKAGWYGRGVVILPFGRYFAGRADMLTRDGFKSIVPIDGISPFSAVGEPDPEMQRFADSERVNDRVRMDLRKNLAEGLARAGADFLVVDNSTALQFHREVNGRLYTVLPGEATDLMDDLWNADEALSRALCCKLSHDGLTRPRRAVYDAFVRACLEAFDPTRIVLVRSHAARFWVADDGTITPTDVDRRDARFLEELDDYFVERTGCRVAFGALGHFPSAVQWQTFDHRLRSAIEDDLAELCTLGGEEDGAVASGVADGRVAPLAPAADHVVGAVRTGRPVDGRWLRQYFAGGGASYDDLLALAYLDQREVGGDEDLIRRCVQHAVADDDCHPLVVTRRRFDRSLRALRGWRWRSVRLPRGEHWDAHIAVSCARVVFRFRGDGSIQRIPVEQVSGSDAAAIVDGRQPITPGNLTAVLESWPVYLERGRRGITVAPRVEVSGADELIDTCSWIDWGRILENERVVIRRAGQRTAAPHVPRAKTDLSFLFDPRTRIGTVGGGLMDQVTHIALFDDLCAPLGLDYYLDDLRYVWWRSHNGFEASRLAPDLERRRITRRVSQALIESFRSEVMRTRLPWVFNQSRTWYDFGLRDATVVTRDYFNSRRLMEMAPQFPVRIYTEEAELGELIREPPSPVCFYTTQHRIPLAPQSAAAIQRVFSYRHLESTGLDPDVARTAELLRGTPHVAFHIRRGDYLHSHFDSRGWHAQQSHYVDAVDYLVESELGTSDFDVAVFSDDLEFVEAHAADYGLDRVTGTVRFIRGNAHYKSIFDSYLMSLCPIIVGSVGSFAATTSLLAAPPSVFIRARPGAVRVEWRR
jgi:hypothetical protein